MRVSEPSLGKYLRRAAASRSWRLELEMRRARAEAHLQKRAPKIGALSRRSWGKGRRNSRAYERTRQR
jgi:hypothetical protein